MTTRDSIDRRTLLVAGLAAGAVIRAGGATAGDGPEGRAADQVVRLGEFGPSGEPHWHLLAADGERLTGVSLRREDPDVVVTPDGAVMLAPKDTDRLIAPGRSGDRLAGTSDQGDFVLTIEVEADTLLAGTAEGIYRAGIVSERNGGGHTIRCWPETIRLGNGHTNTTLIDGRHFVAPTTLTGRPGRGTTIWGRSSFDGCRGLTVTGLTFRNPSGELILLGGETDIDIVGNSIGNPIDVERLDRQTSSREQLESAGFRFCTIKTKTGADWAGRIADNDIMGTMTAALKLSCRRAHPRRLIEGNVIRHFAGDAIQNDYRGETSDAASDGVHETGITIRYNVSRDQLTFPNMGFHSDLNQFVASGREGTEFRNFRYYGNLNYNSTPQGIIHTVLGGSTGYRLVDPLIAKNVFLTGAQHAIAPPPCIGGEVSYNVAIYPPELPVGQTTPTIGIVAERGTRIRGNIAAALRLQGDTAEANNHAIGKGAGGTPPEAVFADPGPFADPQDFVRRWTSTLSPRAGAFGHPGDVWGTPGQSDTWNVAVPGA